jgi:hypothetical protein
MLLDLAESSRPADDDQGLFNESPAESSHLDKNVFLIV